MSGSKHGVEKVDGNWDIDGYEHIFLLQTLGHPGLSLLIAKRKPSVPVSRLDLGTFAL